MLRHALSIFAYIFATVATQAPSHFAINADHYAAIGFMRAEPIVALGVASMVIQGACLSYLFSLTPNASRGIGAGIAFAWVAGAILVSYIALAEVAHFTVPSAGMWVAVEGLTGLAQFTLFGALLGLIHRRFAAAR